MAKEIWDYYLGIKAFIARKIDDEGVIEEITNDVMWAAIKSRQTFAGKSAEFSWICGIAKHKIVDYYRKKKLKTILVILTMKIQIKYPIFFGMQRCGLGKLLLHIN
jgi:DNA-directed RNA polymerase specialized sigma24 family protein